MQYEEIYEKTVQAFQQDEVYELLTGKKGYSYQAPRFPVSIPTYEESVFDIGICPYYQNSSPAMQPEILEKLRGGIRKAMRSEDPAMVWWALLLLFGQKEREAAAKPAPFRIADALLRELAPILPAREEDLRRCKDFGGAYMSEGLWTDVKRLDRLLYKYHQIHVLEEA